VKLTGRRPIEFDPDRWPVIASADAASLGFCAVVMRQDRGGDGRTVTGRVLVIACNAARTAAQLTCLSPAQLDVEIAIRLAVARCCPTATDADTLMVCNTVLECLPPENLDE